MTEIIGKRETEIRFCPRCGSAAVSFSPLEGGDATCSGCNWEGSKRELLVTPISHDAFDDEQFVRGLMNDVRQLLSGQLGYPYLKLLAKWGFISIPNGDPSKIDRKILSRYWAKIGHAIVLTILEERRRIEIERVGGAVVNDN